MVAPKTSAEYTLSNVGWRCAIEVAQDGNKKAVWRCSACWSKRRAEEKTTPGRRIKVEISSRR